MALQRSDYTDYARQVSDWELQRHSTAFWGSRNALSMTRTAPAQTRFIDSRTGGESTRCVISGGPDLGGGALFERRQRFRDEHDAWRKASVCEPRGSDVVVGALLCAPLDASNACGVIFFRNFSSRCFELAAAAPPQITAEDLPLPALAADELACDVLVIGAGIVGLAIAMRLQQEGRRVTLIDRTGVAAEASRGNAGAFAFTDILPLASPGMLRRAPCWLLDSLGPLSIAPAYLPRIAPWLFHFWRASPERVKASAAAQAALMNLSIGETDALLAAAGATDMLRSDGVLHLYESEAELVASQPGWQARADHGIAFTHLHGAQAIAELQPGLSPALVAATFLPAWKTIADTLLLAQALVRRFVALGGRLRRGEALALEPSAGGIVVPLGGSRRITAQQVVVAAGAWSHRLARTLGERIPPETERGYNATLPVAAFDLKRQLPFGGQGFVVTPLVRGVQVGGAVEFTGLDAPPNFERAAVLLAKAKALHAGPATAGGTQWMGFRLCLPDSLPAIGATARGARGLRLRPWSTGPDAGGRHGAADGRHRVRAPQRPRPYAVPTTAVHARNLIPDRGALR